MENKVIAKTLLALRPGLADYETMLGSRAQTHALCSFSTPILTERIIDKIIDLNVKQQTIHNLRYGLERIVATMPHDWQKILRAHYRRFDVADNVPALAIRFGIAERTYFRKLAAATDYLAKRLHLLGINFFTWQHLLQHHTWIKETFTRELTHHRG